jgi:hypothetical protein
MLSSLIFLLALFLQNKKKPFLSPELNSAEKAGLLSGFALVYSSIFFSAGNVIIF